MIIEELFTLPPWVYFEGIAFELQLFLNGSAEARMIYRIAYVTDESPHKAYFDETEQWLNKLAHAEDPPSQGWLYLQEGIETDVDLLWGIRQLWHWLWEKGLMTDKPTQL